MCTLGPATSSKERIRELVDAGMDVARLNLSHGTYDEHEEIYHRVREASDETGHGVGVFVDLQGPKIRLGHFKEGSTRIQTGQSFTITTRELGG
ncbi:MAG: pyk 2, partial [Marmoricola sp.]|nr:pyk 2 [Marmoricola sp.]